MRIAVYGKGGIGKSTISANLSAAFAERGKEVLQVGCDPKHDSTRLLLGGRSVETVLDYLRDTPPQKQRLRDVIHSGYRSVTCVEAGGPEPGVGCAGRGILSAFSLLDRLGCSWQDYDVTLFDVLGDVVCGGFAVPLRKGFAEVVLVVTSEEFMSIYAANNILRGVRNMEQGEPRPVGLVLNRRERDGNVDVVRRFAEAVNVPIVTVVPRSDLFREAEAEGQTVLERFPESGEANIFRRLSQSLTSCTEGPVIPLDDRDLEDLVLDRKRRVSSIAKPGPEEVPCADEALPGEGRPSGDLKSRRFLSKSLLSREPLHGCAFTGSVNTLTQIGDALTLAHGPRSCAHLASSTMLSSGLGTRRRYGTVIPEQLSPGLVSSEMTDEALIHGGIHAFREGLDRAVRENRKAVFVVTTCPAGVIGDDVDQAIRERISPGGPVVTRVETDGNIQGDYLQGVINACIEGAACLIDRRVEPGDDCVNIVAEKNIALNADRNFAEIEGLLKGLGLGVNCRFVRRTNVRELERFLRAPLNLLAYKDHLGRVLQDFLVGNFGCAFAENPFPSGFWETERWLREIASHFDRLDQADSLLETLREEYLREIRSLRPHLAGKRLMLVTYNHDVDWILETAFDVGMEVVKVGIVDYSQDGQYRTRYGDRIRAEVGYNPDNRAGDIEELRPDLCLGNYQSPGLPGITHYDTVPLCPDVGHLGGLVLAQRWRRLLAAPMTEGWRQDEARLLGNVGFRRGDR